ncbi:MAG TPA: bacterial transcriptional activator domain-containing protein [Herpetosiphonaceae bacterium]
MIYVLGDFCVMRGSQLVPLRAGGKSETLLAYLAVEQGGPVARSVLVGLLWPHSEPALASHSLSNHVLALQKLLAPALHRSQPVVAEGSFLRLNVMAGIGIDLACFERLAHTGDQQVEAGDIPAAMLCYTQAVALYRGDLCLAVDMRTIMERERLRARVLTVLSRLTNYCFRNGDDATCLEHLWHLLAVDPCHEEAHRMVMRCYLRRGQRGAALRQYHLCADLLRATFGAVPEPATSELFAQIRDQTEAKDAAMIET